MFQPELLKSVKYQIIIHSQLTLHRVVSTLLSRHKSYFQTTGCCRLVRTATYFIKQMTECCFHFASTHMNPCSQDYVPIQQTEHGHISELLVTFSEMALEKVPGSRNCFASTWRLSINPLSTSLSTTDT